MNNKSNLSIHDQEQKNKNHQICTIGTDKGKANHDLC